MAPAITPTGPVRISIGFCGRRRHRRGRTAGCPEAARQPREIPFWSRTGPEPVVTAPPAVAKATPDGYTLLGAAPGVINGPRHRDLGQDPLTHIDEGFRSHLSAISDYPLVVVVSKDHPARSIQDLTAWLKASPRQGELSHAVAHLHAPDRILQDQDRRARNTNPLSQQQRVRDQFFMEGRPPSPS